MEKRVVVFFLRRFSSQPAATTKKKQKRTTQSGNEIHSFISSRLQQPNKQANKPNNMSERPVFFSPPCAAPKKKRGRKRRVDLAAASVALAPPPAPVPMCNATESCPWPHRCGRRACRATVSSTPIRLAFASPWSFSSSAEQEQKQQQQDDMLCDEKGDDLPSPLKKIRIAYESPVVESGAAVAAPPSAAVSFPPDFEMVFSPEPVAELLPPSPLLPPLSPGSGDDDKKGEDPSSFITPERPPRLLRQRAHEVFRPWRHADLDLTPDHPSPPCPPCPPSQDPEARNALHNLPMVLAVQESLAHMVDLSRRLQDVINCVADNINRVAQAVKLAADAADMP